MTLILLAEGSVGVSPNPQSQTHTSKTSKIFGYYEVTAGDVARSPDAVLLGHGGFGDVYKIRWGAKGEHVAAKYIRAKPEEHEFAVKMLRKEARIMDTVKDHPNIIGIVGLCQKKGSLCLVMELAQRGTLQDVVDKQAMPAMETKFSMVAQVAFGMHHLHDNGIMHHDLKPGNILLSSDFTPKIADFGFSSNAAQTSNHSLKGAGTFTHMAPELAEGAVFTSGCDVYAYGIVLSEILMGANAWAGVNPMSLIMSVSNGERPTLPEKKTDCKFLDADLGKVAKACWSQDPQQRPSFADLSHDFKNMRKAMKHSSLGEVAPLRLVTMDGTPVPVASLDGKSYHGFLSHKQVGGQDQMSCIFQELKLYLDWVNLFLDVEVTWENTGDLESLTEATKMLVLYVSKLQEDGRGGVFDSWYVVEKEVMTALRSQISTVIVRETDDRHGGAALSEIRKLCVDSETVKASAKKAGMTSQEVAQHLFDDPSHVLEWHRERPFKNVTIKMIAEHICGMRLKWQNGDVMAGTASIPNSAITAPAKDFHLFLSEHHPRHREVSTLMQRQWPNLKIKLGGDAKAATTCCDWMFVMLSEDAFTGASGPQYENDVVVWLKACGLERTIPFYEGPGMGGTPFAVIHASCPERLKAEPPFGLGLMSKIAFPWSTSPAHRQICMERTVATILPETARQAGISMH